MTVKNSTPQGPKGYPYIGNLFNLANSQGLDWLQSVAEKYGDVSKFRIIKRNMYLINHPDLVKEVLTHKMHNYSKKTYGFKIIRTVLGESIFTAMGDTWKRKRRLAQPYFHKKIIANLAQTMTDTIDDMREDWAKVHAEKKHLDVGDAMMRLTLTVVVRTLFSTSLTSKEVQTVADIFTPLLKGTNNRILYPIKFLYDLPLKSNIRYKENIEELDRIILGIIKKRRTSGEKPMDLLQMLMDARDEETGQPLNDQELRDEAMTIFIAGHETTANAMTWLWVTLSQHPEIRSKIEEEVDEVLGSRIPVAGDFPKLTYTLKAFKEILRLCPPVPVIPRRVESNDIIGDYFIERGSSVLFSPYLLHRHPDFWEAPETFNPDRFDKELQRRQHPFAYLPFGGGPRICIGNNFAMMEAVFIIAMVLQQYRLELPPQTKVRPWFKLTYRPKGPVRMQLVKKDRVVNS